MFDLKRLPKLAELWALEERFTREQWIDFQRTVPTLIRLQEFPDIAIIALTGIVLPPHQRTLIYQLHRGAGSNIIIASRGTAKSSTVCVLYTTYCNVLFPRRNTVTLSATGFRGGQLIFQDIERWVTGGWIDQTQEVPFFRRSMTHKGSCIHKGQTQWTIPFDSHVLNTTVPTKDYAMLRGIRAQDLNIDEANIVDKELIDVVAIPFLNVKGDFRHGGRYADKNRVFYTTTIDYTWRPFMDRVSAATDGLRRDFQAGQALAAGNLALYDELDTKGLHEHTYTKFDYTDLLVRRFVTDREGRGFEVRWPNPDIEVTVDKRGVPFTQRDPERGIMLRDCGRTEYFQTYPIDKESLERGLRDGSADEASWKSEQRNITDTAVGDVYSNDLVDEATCTGTLNERERCIIPYGKLPTAWKETYEYEPRDYIPPVLWSCTDPCVLGVDYAPKSDFCAFVVIRMGPCAEGEFDPFKHTGNTRWSNVIWAEQHQRMSYREMADRILSYRERYNLKHHFDPYEKDTWKLCRAIGLDMKGGGNGTRDELLWINHQEVPEGQVRIYDPLDTDPRVLAFATDPKAIPMLDCIWPSDALNDKLVEFTVAQMQQKYLYIGKYLEPSQRPTGKPELQVGFDAVKGLERQLRKIRQEPTPAARRFYMDGDTKQFKNKKDLFSAFIYAAKQLRAHTIRQRQINDTPPPMGAVVTRIGSKRGQRGKAFGARD